MTTFQIDYSRADRERRMELLRFYAGDLERARDAERWIVWGEITPTHEMGAERAINPNAAPEGCVDGPSAVSCPADQIVPPSSTPQTDGVCTAPVTPAPDEGVGAGTIPTREGEREGEGNSDVARFAPHLDERADTATQPEMPARRGQLPEGTERPPQGAPPAMACAHCRDGIIWHAGGGDYADDWEEPCPFCRQGVDAPSTPPLGAVAEGDSPRRVAPPTLSKMETVDDGLDIPSFLKREKGLPAAPDRGCSDRSEGTQ